MGFSMNGLVLFLPETMLILGILVVYLSDCFLTVDRRRSRSISLTLTLVSFAGATLSCLALTGVTADHVLPLFKTMVATDQYAMFFKLAIAVAGMVVAIAAYPSSEIDHPRQGEFYATLLASALSAFLLVEAANLLMLYVSLEFLSVTSYILTGLRKQDPRSSEAGLKYIIFGATASAIMLYGFSWLYGLTQTLDMNAIGHELARVFSAPVQPVQRLTAITIVTMTFAGFAFKIAAVPFHMWCPDVYEGAPTPVTAFLSVAPKLAGFAVLVRFLANVFPFSAMNWLALVGIIAAASMTIGNIVAIAQDNVKRMLAYSSIAQAGYLLLGVVTGSQEGTRAMLLYAAVYLFMNLGAFVVVIAVRETSKSEEIKAFAGLGKGSPLLAVAMTIFLFSLVGIPPFGGFIGKFYLFAALVTRGGFWFQILAVIAVVNSAISLYYYARVIKMMFLDDTDADAEACVHSKVLTSLAWALAVPVLVLGVFWAPLHAYVQGALIAWR